MQTSPRKVKGVKGSVNPCVNGETRTNTGVLRVLRVNPLACTRTSRNARRHSDINKVSQRVYTRALHTLNTLNNQVVVRVVMVKGDFASPSHPSRQEKMSQSSGNLRQAMPETTAFIDQMREAFGAEMINAAIRAGIDGVGTFWAKENGHEVGSRPAYSPDRSVSMTDIHIGPLGASKERK